MSIRSLISSRRLLHAGVDAVDDVAEVGEEKNRQDVGHEKRLVGDGDFQGSLAGEDEIDSGEDEHVPEAAADGGFREIGGRRGGDTDFRDVLVAERTFAHCGGNRLAAKWTATRSHQPPPYLRPFLLEKPSAERRVSRTHRPMAPDSRLGRAGAAVKENGQG